MLMWFDGPVEAAGWNSGAWDNGHQARVMGEPQSSCPSENEAGLFFRKSWLAGWADADAGIKSDIESGTLQPKVVEIERLEGELKKLKGQ